ncbi:peptidase C14, partial [Colletotrichum abscissum]|uniref:peptidase C14 n=1 Tax=Colletotrichum abscissum TaxID=1671311 RepID=UPI0027D67B84
MSLPGERYITRPRTLSPPLRHDSTSFEPILLRSSVCSSRRKQRITPRPTCKRAITLAIPNTAPRAIQSFLMAATLNAQENGRGFPPRLDTKSLEKLDTWICNTYYTEETLEVKRLCGDLLPVDQCNVNLVRRESSDPVPSPSPLRIPASSGDSTVGLSKLFEYAKRRILISVHRGAGRTTLCKKIVHAFHKKGMWRGLFPRIVWLPLQYLQTWKGPAYGLVEFLHHIHRQQYRADTSPVGPPQDRTGDPTFRDALLILDGLEEALALLDRQHDADLHQFLLALLNHTDVIITTRPNISVPHDVQEPDVCLEATGLSHDHVLDYLIMADAMGSVRDGILSLLLRIPLLHGLLRIPVMLDALCFVWNDTFADSPLPDTLTDVYRRISRGLLRKDLERRKEGRKELLLAPSESESDITLARRSELLETIAFGGVCSNLAALQSENQDTVHRCIQLSPDQELFQHSSILKPSDCSTKPSGQDTQFIHPIMQHFFAAKYYAHQWKAKRHLCYMGCNSPNASCIRSSPQQFLSSHKYSKQLGLMWPFVAGLLYAEGEHEVVGFLDALGNEPRDTLKVAHQQLVMRCLSELVHLPSKYRKPREDELLRCVLSERELTKSSTFMTEPGLPDTVLHDALNSPGNKLVFLRPLMASQRHVSGETLAILLKLMQKEDNCKPLYDAPRKIWTLGKTAEDSIINRLKGGKSPEASLVISILKWRALLSKGAVELVGKLLKDKDVCVRRNAAQALHKQSLLSETTLEALMEAFQDKDQDLQYDAAQALGEQSRLPTTIEASLKGFFMPTRKMEGYHAALALRKQAALSPILMPDFESLLQDDGWMTQSIAAEALGKNPRLPVGILYALVKLLKGKNICLFDREAAVQALSNQEALSEEVLADLVEFLKSEGLQEYAVQVLEKQSTLPD